MVLGVVVVLVMGLGGSSGCGLLLVANMVLLVLEELLEADSPGHVGCFGLTDGADAVANATICGCVSTIVLGEGCGASHYWLVSVVSWVGRGQRCCV